MKKLLLITAAIVVFVGGGIFAYQQTKNDDKQSQPGPNANQQSAPEQKDPSEGGKYLLLESYKIRIPFSEKIQKLKLGPEIAMGEDRAVPILAPELDDIWKCEADPRNSSKGTIGMLSITPNEKRAGPYEPLAVKKLGRYTYGFEKGGSNCTTSPLYDELVESFKEQFQKAEAY